jgi:hypothetical protein
MKLIPINPHIFYILKQTKKEFITILLILILKSIISYFETICLTIISRQNYKTQFIHLIYYKMVYYIMDTIYDLYELLYFNPIVYRNVYNYVWNIIIYEKNIENIDHKDNNLYFITEKGIESLTGIISKIFVLIQPLFLINSKLLALFKFVKFKTIIKFLVLYKISFLFGLLIIKYDFEIKKKISKKIQEGQSQIIYEISNIYDSKYKNKIKDKIIIENLNLLHLDWRHQSKINLLNLMYYSITFSLLIFLIIHINDKIEPLGLYYILYSIYMNNQYLLYQLQEIMRLASKWTIIDNLE